MADFDFRTSMQAPDRRLSPEVYQLLAQAIQQKNKMYQSFGQNIGAGIDAGFGAYQQKQFQNKIKQNPQLAEFADIITPENAGQLIPSVIKSQTNKPTVSIWRNTETGQTSMAPQTAPGWMEEGGLSPSQRQGALNSSIGAQARTEWADAIKQRTENAVITSIYNDLNSLDKSSGGVLGQASQIQYRAQRGEHLLNTPGIAQDKLVYGLVKADLASIAQGGSPTLAAQAEASLPTFKELANGVLRKITADPQSVDQPQVREQMRKIFQVMGESAGSIIQQNTQGVRSLYENTGWVKQNPQAFQKAIQYLGQGIKPFDASKLPPLGNAPQIPSWNDTQPVEDQ